MLYNKDFLFLHYPKTAGKSISVYFCKNFQKPIHGIVSPGQISEIGMGEKDGVFLEVGNAHCNLDRARKTMESSGASLDSLKCILVSARNPYDLMVSNYYFLREKYEKNPRMRERRAFQLAGTLSFTDFTKKVPVADFKNWVSIDNEAPPVEVRVVKFESMQDDLDKIAREFSIKITSPLLHLNKSERPPVYDSLYTDETKAIVESKFESMFRIGSYRKVLSER